MSTLKEQLLEKRFLRHAKGKEWTRENGVLMGYNYISRGDLTLRLASITGFCYGVLYAIEEIADVLEQHPDKTVWVLGDLIHNAHVNDELEERGARFIDPDEVTRAGSDDIVVVPAFGTREDIFEYLDRENLVTVDTTCPEVRNVEEKVKSFNDTDLTAVIHGKYEHQESVATSSFADRYLIVRDREEASEVCQFIREGGSVDRFLEQFKQACSPGFDPSRDLRRIGLANQTTMLMNESLEIFEMIEQAVMDRDGNAERVSTIDTICSATQDRQDAVKELTEQESFDLFLVVGGFHSSNTKNLARTVESRQSIPVYHIEEQDHFTQQSITYLPTDSDQPVTLDDWLPAGAITVGLTAGASTPHSDLEAVIQKLLSYY